MGPDFRTLENTGSNSLYISDNLSSQQMTMASKPDIMIKGDLLELQEKCKTKEK